ncbi:hypothetical protein A3F03_01945 [Candidatus Roizmanbacteria bacterium RIFCSPHIGHO2_12_FULL_41_11]|uniref:Glycosyltransferase 2-like domain-containing protein n=1 Tax=Candidatus Roizmanbacteria bacterium RIFCSPHIGHO2_12_FULL_41_11 TaxID=1802052 RepID=A0A1F7I4M8_9BACT|nr:MAG: hypothetical protein A3F03_01945 [Candidatus Roizmanbacteria bacterium RIFCSPHIGHO2_12_FULL_41_11]
MVDLSVIVPSYNTKDITKQCIEALHQALSLQKITSEIIVVDNASTDGSREMLKRLPVKLIELPENKGYGVANNVGVKFAQGRYILFLNSDVMIKLVNFDDLIHYLHEHLEVAVLTVEVNLPSGGIDPASHRGFPTIWRTFCYFSKLEQYLGKIPLLRRSFGGYHLLHLDLNSEHEIDSPTGAFYLTRREVIEKVGGFDEQFFMYGEDLDLSYRIKKLGYKIMYIPRYRVLHLKHQSGLKNGHNQIRSKITKHFYQSMKIFYTKHYAQKNPAPVNSLVNFFIDLKLKLNRK